LFDVNITGGIELENDIKNRKEEIKDETKTRKKKVKED